MGKKMHAGWATFERIKNPNNNSKFFAKCRKCKEIQKNTSEIRLMNHAKM